MATLDTLLAAVTDGQHRASVSVMIPLLMDAETLYTNAAINEWRMFKPLADAFATQFAPADALSQPLQFINWICSHPEIAGATAYANHIAQVATDRASVLHNEISNIPYLIYAEQFINKGGLSIAGHSLQNTDDTPPDL